MANPTSMQSFGKDVQTEMVGGFWDTPEEDDNTYNPEPDDTEDTKNDRNEEN